MSVSVCLSVSISLEPLDQSLPSFVCRSPVAVARSSFDGVALRCVLLVLWMTSRLAIVCCMVLCVTPGRSLMSVNELCDTMLESDVCE